ncbi:glycosyltransferase family 2 protein [Desulfogranum japonicum]|uniref:glycosyltransferase family 2 protein n=1 Tax=Desulfogranum japonicum TaxID=231447 RepID=UPI0003F68139|nr:glycosyltransferase family 2 protein [Desulfogranum japonicum]
MQQPIPAVSVIIPTLNAESCLEGLLESLSRQTVLPDEILVIDSSSSDSTHAICRKYQVNLRIISRETFDHGNTRTLAAQKAIGDLLVYFTQDALPMDDTALEKLLRPLLEHKEIAASYGRQLAHPGASLISEHLRLFNYPGISEKRCFHDRHTFGFKTVFISNSFAAYKRKPLTDAGYFPQRQIFGEDTCALARMLRDGYCVQYVHDACVYHSHDYTVAQDFKRYFDIGVLHTYRKDIFAPFGTPAGTGKKYVLSEIRFLLRKKAYILAAQSVLRNMAKYIGYIIGKKYEYLPRVVTRAMSMHSRWW